MNKIVIFYIVKKLIDAYSIRYCYCVCTIIVESMQGLKLDEIENS